MSFLLRLSLYFLFWFYEKQFKVQYGEAEVYWENPRKRNGRTASLSGPSTSFSQRAWPIKHLTSTLQAPVHRGNDELAHPENECARVKLTRSANLRSTIFRTLRREMGMRELAAFFWTTSVRFRAASRIDGHEATHYGVFACSFLFCFHSSLT
jgi:hypothetical protein